MHKLFISILLILTVFSTSLFASYELKATATEPWNWTDFTISWEDVNGNEKFSLNEPFTWNHVIFLPFMEVYWQLLAVPELQCTDGTGSYWQFGPATPDFFVDKNQWTYDCNTPQVPIPGSILLFVSGLLGFGLLGLRRKP